MLSLVGYCVVAFVLGVGSGFIFCKLFKKCGGDNSCTEEPKRYDPLISQDDYWDPAAAQAPAPKKRKGKRKK